MSVVIRAVAADDLPELLGLMREFAEFEGLGQYLKATEAELRAVMFDDRAFVDGLLAVDGVDVVGYALFYQSFSSFGAERGIYLEDLYIRATHRGRGVGRAMLREVAASASAKGAKRIDLLVLNWNETAIDFYKRLGFQANPDDRHLKFVEEGFASLAG